jgi:sulfur relay (sulfurtransferase) complex TusBCD TusD component (DsrE family)
MQFVIGVYGAPESSGAQAAYLFSKALLKKGHHITQIFFYELGVAHADIPSNFNNLNIPLAVCSTLRPTPLQKNIKSLSLVQYVKTILEADRHVIFG